MMEKNSSSPSGLTGSLKAFWGQDDAKDMQQELGVRVFVYGSPGEFYGRRKVFLKMKEIREKTPYCL